MAPLAVILCGKEPRLIEYMSENLLPKIEIIHACRTTDAATAEIPSLLRGEAVVPASGYGSNASSSDSSHPRTDVSFIIIGGGNSPEEVQVIKAAAESVRPVPIFVADRTKIPPDATGPPPPEVILRRILEAVEREEKEAGQWEAGFHWF